MVTIRRNNSYGYTKMEKEDPQEKSHREAQFLIYKTMKQADQINMRRSSWLKLRLCKLKVKIGKKLLCLRKGMLCNVSKTKGGVCKHLMGHFKSFKKLFHGGGGQLGRSRGGGSAINHLPQPFFTI
ncbi:uncharacterized protein LOC141591376 [Silene latifolia]|uniref:uncharacterized protein LOC141591376 n=1 Tax=Silene latifolia TaxID=37657 RepID=UPI003D77414E